MEPGFQQSFHFRGHGGQSGPGGLGRSERGEGDQESAAVEFQVVVVELPAVAKIEGFAACTGPALVDAAGRVGVRHLEDFQGKPAILFIDVFPGPDLPEPALDPGQPVWSGSRVPLVEGKLPRLWHHPFR